MTNYWCTCFLIVFFMLSRVAGRTKVEIYFSSFSSDGLDWEGENCDIFSACDPEFTICVRSPNKKSGCDLRSELQTLPFNHINNILFNENIQGVANPITFTAEHWQGGFTINVTVQDDDSGLLEKQLIDRFDNAFNLTGFPARGQFSAQPYPLVIQGTRENATPTQLKLQIKVYCEHNYYDPTCSTYCVGQNSDTGGHYTCDPDTGEKVCHSGWETPELNCLVHVDDCVGVVCENGGRCVDKYQEFSCMCQAGFTGFHCDVNIDDCADEPCQNNGTCHDLVNGFECTCPRPWIGDKCQLSACHDERCQHGSCYFDQSAETTQCLCDAGFTGVFCDVNICDLIHCENEGTCEGGACVCGDGLTGPNCNQLVCDTMECLNGGQCHQGACHCLSGYSGENCEVDIDDCQSAPCQHDGVCIDDIDAFFCRCQNGFLGERCELEKDLLPWLGLHDEDRENNKGSSDSGSNKNTKSPHDESKRDKWSDLAIAACCILLILFFLCATFMVWRQYRKRHKIHPDMAPHVTASFHRSQPSVTDDSGRFSNPLYETVHISVLSSRLRRPEDDILPPSYVRDEQEAGGGAKNI